MIFFKITHQCLLVEKPGTIPEYQMDQDLARFDMPNFPLTNRNHNEATSGGRQALMPRTWQGQVLGPPFLVGKCLKKWFTSRKIDGCPVKRDRFQRKCHFPTMNFSVDNLKQHIMWKETVDHQLDVSFMCETSWTRKIMGLFHSKWF